MNQGQKGRLAKLLEDTVSHPRQRYSRAACLRCCRRANQLIAIKNPKDCQQNHFRDCVVTHCLDRRSYLHSQIDFPVSTSIVAEQFFTN